MLAIGQINYFTRKCVVGFIVMSMFRNCCQLVDGNHYPRVVDIGRHSIAKRMDLEACIDHFDVHRDTIIRTEESRAMGAKFLDNADVDSRDECQRLCCETDECDVFVFEEKNQGTCFLFDCGPPIDFRCKFTHHANYTSAVLSPSRQVVATQKPLQPPVPMQPVPSQVPSPRPVHPISQHELELKNLKSQSSFRNMAGQWTATTTTTLMPPLGVRPALSATATTAKAMILNSSARGCGRFQFPCHSGECIAVYNACDGIPQCEDGSDEGLECPAPSTVAATKTPPNPNLQPRILMPAIGVRQHQTGGDQQKILMPVMGYKPNNREDPMTSPGQQHWSQLPQPLDHQQSPYAGDQDSHIFNHKGGIQLPAGNIQSYAGVPESPGYGVFPIRNPYENPVRDTGYRNALGQQQQQQQQQQQEQQKQQQQAPLQQVPQLAPQWITERHPPVPPQIDWSQAQMVQPDVSGVGEQQQQQSPPLPSLRQNVVWPDERSMLPGETILQSGQSRPSSPVSAGHQNVDRVEPIVAHKESEEESDYTDEEPKSTEPPKKKQRKHKKYPHNKGGKEKSDQKPSVANKLHEHERLELIKNNFEVEFVDHDGDAERPGGAVLSLTLGVLVTAALAILVGCRMRVVGRRVRRTGKSFAHDADFLVNGMYL